MFLGIHAVVGHSRFPTVPFAAGALGLQLPEASQALSLLPLSRYDTPASSKKKVRPKDRNKLSTEERRKLFEQEVAQREAQKQQQQLQNLGMTSPLPYDSMGYGTAHHGFMGYPPGYPMQAYVDPSNPNAGKVGWDLEHPVWWNLRSCSEGFLGTAAECDSLLQSYAQPGLQYIQGQQIYTAHPQGVIVQPPTAVTTIVAAGQPQPIQQPELVVTNNLLDLPPPSPPKPKTIVLPPNWKTARDPEGKIYYYHVVTRCVCVTGLTGVCR
nr:histone-lysine N-methyltransferase SETD2-like [Zonotrichia albicollis]